MGCDWPRGREREAVELADLRALATPAQHPLAIQPGDPGSLSLKGLSPGVKRAAPGTPKVTTVQT